MKLFFVTFLLIVLTVPAFAQDKDLPPAQAELVNTERAFADLAVKRGFRESFITYFADDGIGFGPHPYKMKEALGQQPAPTNNKPAGFKWAPLYGDISRAGDLGWNTGPVVFESADSGKGPARHGMFFSVWKKQVDGSWRVVLDLGSDTPTAVAPLDARFKSSYRASSRAAANVDLEREIAELLKVEREFLAATKTSSVGQAYESRLSDDARVHRPNVMPIVGKDALRAWLAQQTMTLNGEPIRADVSRSGDLGYAFGKYELGGAKPQKGYYARAWKRDANGQWRIVMDTINPLPPGADFPPTPGAPQSALAQKADAHYQAQQWAEAAAAYQQLVNEDPHNSAAWHRLGTTQIYLKQLPEAIKSLEHAIKLTGGAPLDFYNLACALALSGQTEKALDNLEKAINAGFTNRQQYETDSDLNSLRETERFKQLMKRLS